MDFVALIRNAEHALSSAESRAKGNYNENALAQVAFGYSVLALAEAIYSLSTALKKPGLAENSEE